MLPQAQKDSCDGSHEETSRGHFFAVEKWLVARATPHYNVRLQRAKGNSHSFPGILGNRQIRKVQPEA